MIGALLKRAPLGFWLALAAAVALGLYHWQAVRSAASDARAKLKADIEAEAAKTGRQADAATRAVLACQGEWNRESGRCVK